MSTTKVTLILDGEEVSFEMSKDEVVLDVALSNGIDVPYSCQRGDVKIKNGVGWNCVCVVVVVVEFNPCVR